VKRLVAYVVADQVEGLREFTAQRLPDYLVPSAFVAVEALPVTVNGKLDRNALPAPEISISAGRPPVTEVEVLLCGLFAEVLGLPEVGAEDSFFALGGDSIMSMLVVSRARRAGIVITARQVFELLTVAELARVAEPAEHAAADTGEEPTGPIGLTPVMRELAERAGEAALTGAFTQSLLIQVPAGLRQTALAAALSDLTAAHPVLRARFVADGGGGLVIPEAGTATADRLVRIDVSGLDAAAADTAMRAEAAAAVRRLDPWAGEMLQAVWFDAGPAEPGRLLLVAHHLVVDGVSWRVLLADLTAGYAGDALAPAGTSFARWATALAAQAPSEARVAELPTWRDLLAGPDGPLGPRRLDPAVDTVGRGLRHVSEAVPDEATELLLTRVPELFHAGIDDILLAGLLAAVGEWQRRHGRDDTAGVVVDVEGHGRVPLTDGMDLTRTVGWFTNAYPVRLGVDTTAYARIRSGGAAAGTAVKAVKERLRAVPGDGLGYGLLRFLNPATAEALRELPSAQLGFNYLGRFAAAGDRAAGGDWQPAAETVLGGSSDERTPLSHALEAGAVVRDLPAGPRLTVTLACPAGLFGEEDLAALARAWAEMLAGIARHAAEPESGGHTPSDFPLVALGQDDIEQFEFKLTKRGSTR